MFEILAPLGGVCIGRRYCSCDHYCLRWSAVPKDVNKRSLMIGATKSRLADESSILGRMNAARTTSEPVQADRRLTTDRLEDVFARWQPELLGTLYYLTGNHEDARDALQETFIKCWRHREAVSEVDNLKAWVFRIALNAGRDVRGTAWRRRRTALPNDAGTLPGKDCAPDARMEQAEQLAQLREAIALLRTEEQEVFLLRQNGEMTYEEIAVAIGIPLGTVKTRMRLAIGRLREALAAE